MIVRAATPPHLIIVEKGKDVLIKTCLPPEGASPPFSPPV